MANKDYYEVLGVSRTATQDEIKKAFRKLAHQHHPDKGGGDEAKFKEINEAYQVLSDEQKRGQYDQFGNAYEGSGAGGGARWEDFAAGGPFQGFRTQVNFDDLGDIFGDLFGMGRGSKGQRRPSSRSRGRDLEIDAAVSLRDAVRGVKKKITIEAYRICPHCKGKGAVDASSLKKCSACGGSGEVEQAQRTFFGTFAARAVCPDCRGEGRILEEQALEISIPAGINDGTTLRLSGKGEAGVRGAVSGDLFINVRVAPDERFRRDGDNLASTITLSAAQAALGTVMEVDTIDGPVHVTVPGGTQPGDLVRLREKGVPHMNGTGRGDLLLNVKVAIPKKLTKKQKTLFEALRQED